MVKRRTTKRKTVKRRTSTTKRIQGFVKIKKSDNLGKTGYALVTGSKTKPVLGKKRFQTKTALKKYYA